MKPVKFTSTLICDPPEKGWHYFSVEACFAEQFEKTGGTRRVICTLNGTETFPCALMPYHGIFYVMVNKERRSRLGLSAGSQVTVELTPDESKYGMPMPEEFEEVLGQDPEGSELFHSLSSGRQRSIIYGVAKLKDTDKRIHTALVFIEHLKRNGGKVVYETLREELKRPSPFSEDI